MMYKRFFPIAVFIFFASLIAGSILFYAPSWGLVDDHVNLEFSKFVWSGDFFKNWNNVVSEGTRLWMFRPFYYAYVIFAYHIFENVPLLLYLIIAIFNLVTLALWGVLLNKIWPNEAKNKYVNIFLYPLAFFIFTPFWNIFMYISSQQKFIIFLSALAIYFFYEGCVKERKIYFIFSILTVISGMFIHVEGVFLNLAMLLLSLTLFLFTKSGKYVFSFVLNSILFFSYLFYTVIVQSRSQNFSRYSNNLNISDLAAGFMAAPVLIKGLTIIAVFYFCFLLFMVMKGKNKFSPVFLIVPLSYICFVTVLAPWGYPNYHLSVLTPFIIGMFFPVYLFLSSKSFFFKIIVNSALLAAVLAVLFLVWVPRIAKISDIKKVEQFIVNFEKKGSAKVYFMPQPSWEACIELAEFTGTKTIYLKDSLLSADKLITSADNFVIFRDECPKVYFDGVQESKEIYKNNTWKIFPVYEKTGVKKEFKAYFPENPVERIKTLLKS